MLLGIKTRPISDFLPRVMVHVDGANTDMVLAFIMDAVMQFLRDTKILREVVCLDLSDCLPSYKLNTDYRINEVMGVRFFVNGVQQNTIEFTYRIQDDVFYVQDIPPHHGVSVEVDVSTMPLRDSDEVPEFLYEEWLEPITAYVLAKLFLMPNMAWTSATQANNQMAIYQTGVRQARFSTITKNKPLALRLSNMRRF